MEETDALDFDRTVERQTTERVPNRVARGYRPALPAASTGSPTTALRHEAAGDRAPTTVRHEAAGECTPSSLQVRKQPGRAQLSPVELPVAMLVLEGMKLAPYPAHLTEVSRSVAFVATRFQPAIGRRVVIRVAHEGRVGTAVGSARTVLEGTGFTVRITASTRGFRSFADSVCSFARGKQSRLPHLQEPIAIDIL